MCAPHALSSAVDECCGSKQRLAAETHVPGANGDRHPWRRWLSNRHRGFSWRARQMAEPLLPVCCFEKGGRAVLEPAVVVFMQLGRPAARQSHFALPALWSTRYSGSTRLATTVFQSDLARLVDCLCLRAYACACVLALVSLALPAILSPDTTSA